MATIQVEEDNDVILVELTPTAGVRTGRPRSTRRNEKP